MKLKSKIEMSDYEQPTRADTKMSSVRKNSTINLKQGSVKQSIPRASSVKAKDRVSLLKSELHQEAKIKSKLKQELVSLRTSMEAGKGFLKSRQSAR